MPRNSVAVFDPELARKHTQAELREKAIPKKVHEANKLGSTPYEISNEQKAKMAAAMAKELEKIKQMADERRRRDPTFRPDAVDLDRSDYSALCRVARACVPAQAASIHQGGPCLCPLSLEVAPVQFSRGWLAPLDERVGLLVLELARGELLLPRVVLPQLEI